MGIISDFDSDESSFSKLMIMVEVILQHPKK